MTLADSCHDEVLAIAEARQRGDSIIEGVRELLRDVEWYSDPDHPLGYPTHPGSEIDALRRAIQRVLEHPDDKDALHWLLVLAECVRVLHDRAEELDIWCALHLRGHEDALAGRCPKCGAKEGWKKIRLRSREAEKR
jgi:hypothetical protein